MVEIWVSLSTMRFSSYQVSDLGNVRNARTSQVLKQRECCTYMYVSLYDDNFKIYPKRVASLVIGAFVGPKPDGKTVDHINRERCDNRIINLRYATPGEQAANSNHPLTKPGISILQYDLFGNFVKFWLKIKDASDALKICNISKACKGKISSAGNFIWRYYVEYITDEEWRSIIYKEVEFWASTHGRIRMPSGKIIYGCEDNYGYLQIKTTRKEENIKIRINVSAHRIVAAAFLGPNNLYVNHIDGNKANNKIKNLEYRRQKGNMDHAVQMGLIKTKPVQKFNLSGEFLDEYFSITEAAKKNNLYIGGIVRTCKDRQKTCGDFIWKYANPNDLIIDDSEQSEEDIDDFKHIIASDMRICTIQNKVKSLCPVYQFSLNEKFFAKYSSLRCAAGKYKIHSSSIIGVCEGTYKTSGDFIWRYDIADISSEDIVFAELDASQMSQDEIEKLKHIKASQISIRSIEPELRKSSPVYQFDLNGKFMAKYTSIKDAALRLEFSAKSIVLVCEGKQRTCSYFIWRYCVIDTSILDVLRVNQSNLQISDEELKKLTSFNVPICTITGMTKISISVYQFDLNGKFVMRHDSIRDIAHKYEIEASNFVYVCEGKHKTCSEFIWRYDTTNIPSENIVFLESNDLQVIQKNIDEVEKLKQIKASQIPIRSIETGSRVLSSVYQFNLDGDFTAKHNSIVDAASKLRLRTDCIVLVCEGKSKTHGKFIWRYAIDTLDVTVPKQISDEDLKKITISNIPAHIVTGRVKVLTPVYRFDLDGRFLERYTSIKDAAEKCELNASGIILVCEGKRKTCAKFIWRYAD